MNEKVCSFFVISGYLMTSILAKSPNQSLLEFYSRRIKRIFPTCLLVIAVFTGIGVFWLLPSHFEYLKAEALWSALFINNFSTMFSEKQYFELVSFSFTSGAAADWSSKYFRFRASNSSSTLGPSESKSSFISSLHF